MFDDREALEAVASSVMGSKKSTKKNIDNSASELYGYLEDFLLLNKLREKNHPLRERLLGDIFRERQLSKPWNQKMDALLKRYATTPPADQWDVLEAMYVQYQVYYSPLEEKNKSRTEGQAQLHSLMDKLELFFQTAKLLYGIELLSRQNVLHETNYIEDWEELKAKAAKRTGPLDVLVQVLLLTAQLLEAPSDDNYRHLRDFFMAHYSKLSPRMHPVIQGYVHNYISLQLRNSRIEFVSDAFEQYKFEVEHLSSISQGDITITRFINIVSIACSAKELDWAEGFIASRSTYLHESFRGAAERLATALIIYEKQEYEEVRRRIIDLEKTIPRLETYIKAIDILCCLHLEIDKDYVKGKCDNYLAYLKQHDEIGNGSKEAFRNFIRMANAYNTNPSKAPKLKIEIEEMKTIYFKEWLLKLFNQA